MSRRAGNLIPSRSIEGRDAGLFECRIRERYPPAKFVQGLADQTRHFSVSPQVTGGGKNKPICVVMVGPDRARLGRVVFEVTKLNESVYLKIMPFVVYMTLIGWTL